MEILARGVMDRFGLQDWDLTFDRAVRRAGLTDFTRRRISLSRPLMAEFEPPMVRETILHEVAHALAGPRHNHDAEWKKLAAAIGANPRARITGAPAPDPKWRAVCPNGHVLYRYRRPSGPVSCTQCSRTFNPDFLLRWEKLR